MKARMLIELFYVTVMPSHVDRILGRRPNWRGARASARQAGTPTFRHPPSFLAHRDRILPFLSASAELRIPDPVLSNHLRLKSDRVLSKGHARRSRSGTPRRRLALILLHRFPPIAVKPHLRRVSAAPRPRTFQQYPLRCGICPARRGAVVSPDA